MASEFWSIIINRFWSVVDLQQHIVTRIIQSKPTSKSTKYVSKPLMHLDGDITFSDAFRSIAWFQSFFFFKLAGFTKMLRWRIYNSNELRISELCGKIWTSKSKLEMMKKLKLIMIYWLLKYIYIYIFSCIKSEWYRWQNDIYLNSLTLNW